MNERIVVLGEVEADEGPSVEQSRKAPSSCHGSFISSSPSTTLTPLPPSADSNSQQRGHGSGRHDYKRAGLWGEAQEPPRPFLHLLRPFIKTS
jgi:hypothetical protein